MQTKFIQDFVQAILFLVLCYINYHICTKFILKSIVENPTNENSHTEFMPTWKNKVVIHLGIESRKT